MTRSREEDIPFEPVIPGVVDSQDQESRDSPSLLEIEKKTGKRTMGWTRSPYMRDKGAQQVYELRGGAKRKQILQEEARYRKYGLSGEDVALLLISQKGACVGCGALFGEINFVIDHDHETGKVRGLLCRDCNIVLAHWMTPGKLRRLASYLERSSS